VVRASGSASPGAWLLAFPLFLCCFAATAADVTAASLGIQLKVRQQPASFYISPKPKLSLALDFVISQPKTRIEELSPLSQLQVAGAASFNFHLSQLALTLRTPRNIGPVWNFRNEAFSARQAFALVLPGEILARGKCATEMERCLYLEPPHR